MVSRHHRKSSKRRRAQRAIPLTASADLYLNRELSLLAFNERVLAMAARTSVPLAERLLYVCIL
jgi:polyphosphate kinase